MSRDHLTFFITSAKVVRASRAERELNTERFETRPAFALSILTYTGMLFLVLAIMCALNAPGDLAIDLYLLCVIFATLGAVSLSFWLLEMKSKIAVEESHLTYTPFLRQGRNYNLRDIKEIWCYDNRILIRIKGRLAGIGVPKDKSAYFLQTAKRFGLVVYYPSTRIYIDNANKCLKINSDPFSMGMYVDFEDISVTVGGRFVHLFFVNKKGKERKARLKKGGLCADHLLSISETAGADIFSRDG
ncbi:MAG: hypothetical protein FWD81_03980 [Methanomassiliicoccaceae archaeon]|nr:hypothetical protein [Methanomassiliicoccaceae archaeon]